MESYGRWRIAAAFLAFSLQQLGSAQAGEQSASVPAVSASPAGSPAEDYEPPPSPSPLDHDRDREPAARLNQGQAASPDTGAFDTLDEQVQQRVARARAAFSAGHYDAALADLESAYKLKPNPNYLFSMAQCHRRSGRNRDALTMYQRFLRESPKSGLRMETLNYISELNTLIAQDDAIEQERRRPVWRKGWFWGVLASATVATGVALGVGLGVGLRQNPETIGFQFPNGSTASGLVLVAGLGSAPGLR